MDTVDRIYSARFSAGDRRRKDRLWRLLCENFLQHFIGKEATVLDLGAGYCEFINHIRCSKKFAVDLSPATQEFAHADVTALRTDSTNMPMIADCSIDVVFCSNFFEHLPSKDALLQTLQEVHRILRTDGKLIVIQPNIKYALKEYWDFLDHHLPLSHLSMEEALASAGFQIDTLLPRFLPFTTKTRLPQSLWLLRIYLRLPPLWRIFGKQMFIVVQKLPE